MEPVDPLRPLAAPARRAVLKALVAAALLPLAARAGSVLPVRPRWWRRIRPLPSHLRGGNDLAG